MVTWCDDGMVRSGLFFCRETVCRKVSRVMRGWGDVDIFRVARRYICEVIYLRSMRWLIVLLDRLRNGHVGFL